MICCVIYGHATSQFLYSFLFSSLFFFLQSPVWYYGSWRNLWTTHPFCRFLFTSAAASGCDFGQQRLPISLSPYLTISLPLFEVEAARASHAKLKFGREACWHLSHKGWLPTVFSLLFHKLSNLTLSCWPLHSLLLIFATLHILSYYSHRCIIILQYNFLECI